MLKSSGFPRLFRLKAILPAIAVFVNLTALVPFLTSVAAAQTLAERSDSTSTDSLIEFMNSLLAGVGDLSGRQGPEWTFTNDEMIAIGRILSTAAPESTEFADADRAMTDLRNGLLEKWLNSVKMLCADCSIEIHESPGESSSATIEYSPGQKLFVSKDPWVFEVTGTPFELSDFIENRNSLEAALWKSAAAANLKPHFRVGGGHRHFEDSSFFHNDFLLYVNFFVFLANNPEMFMGPLGFDFTNSPPLALLSKPQKDELEKILSEVDKNEINSIAKFKEAVKNRVYTKAFYYTKNQELEPWKYHGVNTAHAITTEVRALRPQKDFESDLSMQVLFLRIRNHLQTIPGRIAYDRKSYSTMVEVEMKNGMQTYKLLVSPSVIRSQFRSMLAELGLDREPFRSMSGEDFDLQLDAEKIETRAAKIKSEETRTQKTCKKALSGIL